MPLTSHRPAQSLLEAVIAIGVILVATVSATTVIITTISAGQYSEDKIKAANFAREGVEIVRGIRDSNWLKRAQNVNDVNGNIYSWNTGLAAGSYQAVYIPASASWSLSSSGTPTVITQTGVSYFTQACVGTCTPTKFNRLITVASSNDTFFAASDGPNILVTSTVTWNNHGNKTYTATETIYDWR